MATDLLAETLTVARRDFGTSEIALPMLLEIFRNLRN
jgi:hypothetical protein